MASNILRDSDLFKNYCKSYLIGFLTSVLLTIISFAVVLQRISIDERILVAVLIICAIFQVLIHLKYFLHLSSMPEQRWNLIAFIFAVLVISILVTGSLWIMGHLDHNLMAVTDVY
ncbi:cytochrome o ubiquinol oxidase subunit IV [Sodalis sp. CWE]|uniref:cytochrome o ubiquinol oxidase subunit IV n=1 Tax=Sodalis sp. CWE TaxID=2803816 RepID=UPI001C7DB279|nr:cytochrome o ubiquinol oxidase subunit IV [Sodalis sp. CWE]MBX4181200.1 cytochrome o ubiquinol oxidase subunit IV [Sodalis sp. CWE]